MNRSDSSFKNTEIELKYSLSKKEFEALKKHLNAYPHKTKNQTNHYFDSQSLNLKRNKIGLRIRTSGKSHPILTLKFPKSHRTKNITGLKIRYEYEAVINPKKAKLVIAGKENISNLEVRPIKVLKRKSPKKTLNQLVRLGSLQTQRTTYQYSPKVIFEMDRFKFFGKTFFELELETVQPQKADQAVKELFKKLKIRYKPEQKSKLSRFLKEWLKQKKA